MSATDLLHEIKRLPAVEQQWLIERVLGLTKANQAAGEDTQWSKYSAKELLAHYAVEDSVYDQD